LRSSARRGWTGPGLPASGGADGAPLPEEDDEEEAMAGGASDGRE
jgi:hypothetical protein